MDYSAIIEQVCLNIDSNEETAKSIIEKDYPFHPIKYQKRGFAASDTLKVFVRDGFIDRYFGTRMIYPPVLRILSYKFPNQFPYHPNWKMDSCHIAYWELVPTLDHVVPIARGGTNSFENIVCTSMLHNSVKSNYTLEQIGWHLRPCGNFHEWDGMIHWYISYMDSHPQLKKFRYFKNQYNLAVRELK
jgi:hypothetical protein